VCQLPSRFLPTKAHDAKRVEHSTDPPFLEMRQTSLFAAFLLARASLGAPDNLYRIPSALSNTSSTGIFTSTASNLDAPKVLPINGSTFDWWYFDVVDINPNSRASAAVVLQHRANRPTLHQHTRNYAERTSHRILPKRHGELRSGNRGRGSCHCACERQRLQRPMARCRDRLDPFRVLGRLGNPDSLARARYEREYPL
jgi:hypothetical protein